MFHKNKQNIAKGSKRKKSISSICYDITYYFFFLSSTTGSQKYMIRRKIRKSLRQIAIKVLDMDYDVQERAPREEFSINIDAQKIPKIVDGSGDTPGPNHKTNIGRTWLSAVVASGASPLCIDIRPPNEVVSGIIPGAILYPGRSILDNLDRLEEDAEKIVLYDQTGERDSVELTEILKEKGWPMVRSLAGGFAEWLEFGEQIEEIPKLSGELQIGDAVYTDSEKTQVAYIFSVSGTKVKLWSPSDDYVGEFSLDEIFS